jgi:DNA-binding transcriptional MerR regulator
MTGTTRARGLRIGELAKLSGVTTRTIRYYHARGLLPEAERDTSGYRRYDAAHLVVLARVRRLRAVGMPVDQIAAALAADPGNADLGARLRQLADDLARQIDGLRDMRSRLLSFAASATGDTPADALAAHLRTHGLLGEVPLPPAERAAAALVDSLHPGGIDAVLHQLRPLMADAASVERFSTVLRHIQQLPDDADDDMLDALVAELVDVLPRPEHPVAPIDTAALDALVGHHLTSAQRRLWQRFKQAAEHQAAEEHAAEAQGRS